MSVNPYENPTYILRDVQEVVREAYRAGDILDMVVRAGKTTNKIFTFPTKKAGLDGIILPFKIRNAYNAHMRSNPNGDFPSTTSPAFDNVKAQFDEDGTANDFMTIDGSVEISYTSLKRSSERMAQGDTSVAVDIANDLIVDVSKSFDETLAVARNVGRDARIATVNGTPKQNDGRTMASSSATPGAGTGIRIQIDGGALASLREGRLLVFFNGSSLRSSTPLQVRDVNWTDGSIGLEVISGHSGFDYSTIGVADNDDIYYSDSEGNPERGVGIYGVAAWFQTPESGETFFHQKDGTPIDRTDPRWRFMVPKLLREEASSLKKVSVSDIDDLADAFQNDYDDELTPIITSGVAIVRSLRDQIGEDAFRPISVKKDMSGRAMNLGARHVVYEHPAIGPTMLIADPLHSPNELRLIIREDWESYTPLSRNVEFIHKGDLGPWYWMQSAEAGKGQGRKLRADATMTITDFCTNPRRQGAVKNIKA